MTMNIKTSIFLLLCLFLFTYINAQNNNGVKNELEFNIVEGKTVIEDDDLVDTLGFGFNDDDDSFDEIPNRGPSVQFLYFEWMSGYGLYNHFDVTSVHYKHEGSVAPDTLILVNYQHPAPYKVTSNYGKRRRRMHYGVDLGYPVGTPVVAVFDGIVRISQTNAGGYGNLVVLRHNNGLETYYGHLSKRLVNPGQEVKVGDTIGLGGNTGRSYGSHLHFETRYLGTPFNPNKIIDFAEQKLKCDTLYIKGCQAASQIVANTTPTSSGSGSVAVASAGSSSGATYYKVRNGDTLSHIAARYRTSVTKIKKLNGLKSDFLRVGQNLRVR